MKIAPIQIAGRYIGEDYQPYVVAEMSANHNGSIDRAMRIIEEAHRAGAHAVKLQTYTADTITMNLRNEEFMIRGGLWDGKNLYELYKAAAMPWDWHKPLFDFAHELGIAIFSSPFDFTAVDLLESLDAPAYKIASFEAIDLPLIKYVAQTGKPMIISTGMANQDEIKEAIEAARKAGCKELAILRCVSGYPAPPADYNLLTIPDMKERFAVNVGLSDHTMDNVTAIASVSLGACIIEKHFTLDRNEGGTDDSFSLEPPDLRKLCDDSKVAWEARGAVNYKNKSSEKDNIKYRRSLYLAQDIDAGELVQPGMIRSIRPGFGEAPKYLEYFIGKRAIMPMKAGTPVKFENFSKD